MNVYKTAYMSQNGSLDQKNNNWSFDGDAIFSISYTLQSLVLLQFLYFLQIAMFALSFETIPLLLGWACLLPQCQWFFICMGNITVSYIAEDLTVHLTDGSG